MVKKLGDGIYSYKLKNGELKYGAYAFNGVEKGTGKQSKIQNSIGKTETLVSLSQS